MKKEPKCKKCRRIGEKLFLKGSRCFSQKCAIVRNPKLPGIHAKPYRLPASEYGIQLREKQKAKYIYGISDRQMKIYFKKAAKKKRNIGNFLLQFLEKRLDNVVYRLGLASSRSIARQNVSHGHFLVNDKKVDIPSYQIKIGDTIKLNPKLKDSEFYKDLKISLKDFQPPSWLSLDKEKLIGKVIELPTFENIESSLNTNLIVEYFSH